MYTAHDKYSTNKSNQSITNKSDQSIFAWCRPVPSVWVTSYSTAQLRSGDTAAGKTGRWSVRANVKVCPSTMSACSSPLTAIVTLKHTNVTVTGKNTWLSQCHTETHKCYCDGKIHGFLIVTLKHTKVTVAVKYMAFSLSHWNTQKLLWQ